MPPRIDAWHGFEVRIYTREHQPPHVHIWKHDANLRVYLTENIPAERVHGRMTASDERQAIELVARNRDWYLQRWKEIDPK